MDAKPKIPGFELLSPCGRGGSGTVWWAIDAEGTNRAVKVIPLSGRGAGFARQEREALSRYRAAAHNEKHLIDIIHVGETPEYFFYVMPLADSRYPMQCRYQPLTLKAKNDRKLPDYDELMTDFLAILAAVAALHRNGLAHGDLKLENIVFINNTLVLADPGLVLDCAAGSDIGTPDYKPDFFTDGIGGDIYALGKILYALYTGNSVGCFPELPPKLAVRHGYRLNLVALKCCDPDCRYTSVEEIIRDLDYHPPRNIFRNHAKWLIGAAVLLIMLTASAAFLADRLAECQKIDIKIVVAE